MKTNEFRDFRVPQNGSILEETLDRGSLLEETLDRGSLLGQDPGFVMFLEAVEREN